LTIAEVSHTPTSFSGTNTLYPLGAANLLRKELRLLITEIKLKDML